MTSVNCGREREGKGGRESDRGGEETFSCRTALCVCLLLVGEEGGSVYIICILKKQCLPPVGPETLIEGICHIFQASLLLLVCSEPCEAIGTS